MKLSLIVQIILLTVRILCALAAALTALTGTG